MHSALPAGHRSYLSRAHNYRMPWTYDRPDAASIRGPRPRCRRLWLSLHRWWRPAHGTPGSVTPWGRSRCGSVTCPGGDDEWLFARQSAVKLSEISQALIPAFDGASPRLRCDAVRLASSSSPETSAGCLYCTSARLTRCWFTAHGWQVSHSRKAAATVGLLVIGAALAVAAVLLRGQGLDRAGQWVAIMGFFVSTVLSAAGLVLGWLTWRQNKKHVAGSSASGQVVNNVAADGVIQVSEVRGNVGIGVTASSSAVVSGVPAPQAPAAPPSSEGQSVTNSLVEGVIRQVRGVGGNVEIDP